MTEPISQPYDQDDASPETTLAPPRGADARTGEILATPPAIYAGLPIIRSFDELVEASIQRILNAATVEELLADPEAAGLRDYVGKVLVITDVTGIMPSKLRDGDYYAVVEAIDEATGRPLTLTTGSPYAGGRLAVAKARGWLPRRMRVLELESASNPGQSSLWVVDAGPVVAEPAEEKF